jgi:hypothetical protein
MKKVLTNLAVIFAGIIALSTTGWAQQQKQTKEKLLQIIKVAVPDSVVFRLTAGNEISWIGVSLVSGEQSFTGETSASGIMSMRNGEMIMTDKTTLTAKEFNVPAGFKAKQIVFNTSAGVLYYNIATKSWTGK